MEEEKNQNQDSFVKRNMNKGKSILEKGKKTKEKAQKFTKTVKFIVKNWKLILIGLGLIGVVLLFGIIAYAINELKFWEGSEAKKNAVTISVNGKPQSTTVTLPTYGAGATEDMQVSTGGSSSGEDAQEETTKIVISKTENGNYDIETKYTEEELEEIKEKLEETTMETTEFSEFELAVIGALEENGLDVDDYTTKELKCLPAFLKAEASTQFLDLRKNTEKFDSQGNYQPELLEDLEEDEVPGVILIQRTNTKEKTPTPLEYIDLEDFDELVENKDMKVLEYFTVTEEGKLRIAKWNHEVVTVEGEYPEELSDDEKVQPKNETSIWTEDIDYIRYISKYVMPYDFLLQLLIISEDSEFCLEVADIVLGSKIVINLQEEETITTTVDERTFDVHNKVEKKIDYSIGNESANGYLLGGATDDKGAECTTYENTESTVKVKTVYTSHTYKLEIVEADIWYARYEKIYKDPTEKNESLPDQIIEEHPENYTLVEAKKKETTNTTEILADEHASAFKEEREKHYKDQIEDPTVSLTSEEKEIYDYTQQKFVKIPGDYTVSIWHKYGIKEPTWSSKTFSTYADLPSLLNITTNKTNDFPFEIKFSFPLGANSYGSPSRDTSAIVCNITKLLILPYNKINIDGTIKTNVKKYESDPEPTTKARYYAKDENGDFEKFLKTIDDFEKAEELLGDVESWLFEMMEECETTTTFVDIVKYLLYLYDGVDRGVTELDTSIFEPAQFIKIGGIYGNTIEEKIWFALRDAGYSEYAAAGAMGNLYAESGLKTNNLEGSFETKLGYTDESYTEAINNGTYTRAQFISDHTSNNCGAGYGLAQWTWYTRKAGLYDFAKSKGVSIDDEDIQIEYLLGELSYSGGADGYATYQLGGSSHGYTADSWQNATSVDEATEAFCWIFENPSVPHMAERKAAANRYYQEYQGKTRPSFSVTTVKAAGYEFPMYNQYDYPGSFGSSTIPRSGCGAVSLAMILAGLKGDPSIDPYSVVENLNDYYPDRSYYIPGTGSSHKFFGTDFLEKYYGVTSELTYPGEAKAMQALEQGYCLIGGEDGHILAIIPAPDEYKAQGYKFYILDSARGHSGAYRSVADANTVVRGNLDFIAIIKP